MSPVDSRLKQQAIRAVGSLAVDAEGNLSSFADPLTCERASVSVPFGNCTEPSNVKAGGCACPIHFQCTAAAFIARTRPNFPPYDRDPPGVRAAWSPGAVTGQRGSAGVAAARPGAGVLLVVAVVLRVRGARSPAWGNLSKSPHTRSAVCF